MPPFNMPSTKNTTATTKTTATENPKGEKKRTGNFTPLGALHRLFPVLYPDFIQLKEPTDFCLHCPDNDYCGIVPEL